MFSSESTSQIEIGISIQTSCRITFFHIYNMLYVVFQAMFYISMSIGQASFLTECFFIFAEE